LPSLGGGPGIASASESILYKFDEEVLYDDGGDDDDYQVAAPEGGSVEMVPPPKPTKIPIPHPKIYTMKPRPETLNPKS